MTGRQKILTVAGSGTLSRPQAPLHPIPSFTPEMELLLCCGGPRVQAINRERLERICASDLDWQLALTLAHYHHLVPLLCWNVTQLGLDEPGADIKEMLKDTFIRNGRWSLTMTAEFLNILQAMENSDILTVPYKGPVLASRLYGNLTLRQSADLDIVVRRSDVERARVVLIDLGYTPFVMLHDANHDFQVESRYSERFDRPGSVVELHWAFTNKDVAFPLSLEDLADRLGTHHVSGRPIRVFSPEDTLLILSVHGAKHGWGRLEWICGVAELIHSEEGLAWPDVVERASETRSLRRLLLGACLAHDLYQAPLPDEIEERIRRDPQVTALAASVTSSLYDGHKEVQGIHTFGTLDHDIFHYRLGDRLPDSLRYLLYRVTTPSRPERWSTITIRGRPVTLHSFTRPFGILAKLIPAIWRRYTPNHSRSEAGHE